MPYMRARMIPPRCGKMPVSAIRPAQADVPLPSARLHTTRRVPCAVPVLFTTGMLRNTAAPSGSPKIKPLTTKEPLPTVFTTPIGWPGTTIGGTSPGGGGGMSCGQGGGRGGSSSGSTKPPNWLPAISANASST
jgi:hypothetical protein